MGTALPPTARRAHWREVEGAAAVPADIAQSLDNAQLCGDADMESGCDAWSWIDPSWFDRTCLTALDGDEQLLNYPTESFADVCWAAAVDDPSNDRPVSVVVVHSHPPPSHPPLAPVESRDAFYANTPPAPPPPVNPPQLLPWPHPSLKFSGADPRDAIGFFPTPRPRRAPTRLKMLRVPGAARLLAYFHARV
ncbi:hypothetical protein C8R44DRAFT_738549 [Mycena epipterygia]|nr:hypothetical protein C8R44DRAFT_738549 [Mycena epipterygia]